MKNKALATILISALLASAIAGVFVVRLGKANPSFIEGSDNPPSIYLNSPLNKTYNGIVFLNFTIHPGEYWSGEQIVNSVSYSVDWKNHKTITVNSNLFDRFNYSAPLENLTDGNHILRIFVDSTGWIRNPISGEISHPQIITSAIADFTLHTTSPTIQILTLENKTYYESNLQLNFTVSEDFHNASYVLDGQNVPVAGNFTLPNFPSGNHNLTVYAYDYAGNVGVSDTINFTVAEPFPTTLIAASALVVIVAIIGLLVYFKKYHKGKSP